MALVSQNSLADMVASLALATALDYAITAYACVWTYRRTLLTSARDSWLRGAFPFVGAVAMTWVLVQRSPRSWSVALPPWRLPCVSRR